MDALVLGGGALKGAYQAGVVDSLFRCMPDFNPKIVRGISVGSLNSAFLLQAKSEKISWVEASTRLVLFWETNIYRPKDIVEKKKILRLAYEILFKKFRGITYTKPIDSLLENIVNIDDIRKTDIDYKVGAVKRKRSV